MAVPVIIFRCASIHGRAGYNFQMREHSWPCRLYETGTAMNARASENYLAISRSSSASKSVEIFWAEIYWGRLIFRAESSLT